VVPVEGGLEDGLPTIQRPDRSSADPALPWEPHAAWCLGAAFTPDGAAETDGAAHRGPGRGGGSLSLARLRSCLGPSSSAPGPRRRGRRWRR